ncbi:MAG: hypothetical protein LBF40_00240 [Deltaproteobacteria bacterium]|jgi:hypothetical protein|nr:hypothetical protein [Deltaproteobacteria bacterium]
MSNDLSKFISKTAARSLCLLGIPAILGALALTPFFAGDALAHEVYLFAYDKGSQICSESYFSADTKVRGGKVTVKDAAGKDIANGVTDDSGNYCFNAPKDVKGDLHFSLDAGEGHFGAFILRADQRAPWAPGSTTGGPSTPPAGK